MLCYKNACELNSSNPQMAFYQSTAGLFPLQYQCIIIITIWIYNSQYIKSLTISMYALKFKYIKAVIIKIYFILYNKNKLSITI